MRSIGITTPLLVLDLGCSEIAFFHSALLGFMRKSPFPGYGVATNCVPLRFVVEQVVPGRRTTRTKHGFGRRGPDVQIVGS